MVRIRLLTHRKRRAAAFDAFYNSRTMTVVLSIADANSHFCARSNPIDQGAVERPAAGAEVQSSEQVPAAYG